MRVNAPSYPPLKLCASFWSMFQRKCLYTAATFRRAILFPTSQGAVRDDETRDRNSITDYEIGCIFYVMQCYMDGWYVLCVQLEMNISRMFQGLPMELEKGRGRGEGFFARNQELVIGIFIAVLVVLMLIFSLGCYCHQRSQANYPHHFTATSSPRNTVLS